MSFSKVQIFNIVLRNLGVSISIQNIDQADVNTTTLKTFYDLALQQALKDFDWNFASTIRELSLTGNASDNPKYEYEYDYPNDCLAARELVNNADEKTNFQVASNFTTKSRVINTNITPAYLRYTRRVDNEAEFTAEFIMAFSWYLAFLSALAITGSDSKRSEAFKIYNGMKLEGIVSNANEGYEDEPSEASWIEAR